ncbi:MAG: lipid-binding SYLF domain-containing protein [Bacillota bacterium]
MKIKSLTVLLVCCGLVLTLGVNSAAAEESSPQQRIEESRQILDEISQQKDAESMAYLLAQARGVVLFPQVVKGGFMFGGRYGEGLVLKRGSNGEWYGPYFIELKGLSYGFQAGVQSSSLILVITSQRGLDNFKQDNFTLGGGLSIAAGPVGRTTEAGTDIELEAAIYSYSMSKGAFAGVSVEGAKISNDKSANKKYWNQSLSVEQILQRGANGGKIDALVDDLEGVIELNK